MFEVIRVSSVHDNGTPIFSFPTKDAATKYVAAIEGAEVADMAKEGYWYEITEGK